MPRTVPDIELVVTALGARGDGIADLGGERIHVPLAAPGERVLVSLATSGGRQGSRRAHMKSVLEPGRDRIRATCSHFGDCGGCSVQHVAPARVAAEKRRLLVDALARRGLGAAPVRPIVSTPPGGRRRVRLRAVRKGGIALGFNARASDRVVAVRECPAVVPAIAALIGPIRTLSAQLETLCRAADIDVLASETGVDVAFRPDPPAEPALADREMLAAFAEQHDLARVAWDAGAGPEPVAARRAVVATFGQVAVPLPPGAFVQPSASGEAAIARLVIASVGNARTVADLYAGCGTLSFPLARRSRVHAFEGEAAMAAALASAARGHPIAVEQRDLARNPLGPEALSRFEAVVFDPPRAGAASQAACLARSRVPTVVAVSCEPATLARDLRTLVDGGYVLEAVTPVDQFVWTMHLEAVAVLRRTI